MTEKQERRVGMQELQTDIALIRQKTEFIEEKVNAITAAMEAVKNKLEATEILKKGDLDIHAKQDSRSFAIVQWAMGFGGVLLMAILWFVVTKKGG